MQPPQFTLKDLFWMTTLIGLGVAAECTHRSSWWPGGSGWVWLNFPMLFAPWLAIGAGIVFPFRRSRALIWALGVQLIVYAIYITRVAMGNGSTDWFLDAVISFYCWFSRIAILKFADLTIADKWARIGFLLTVGPLIGILVYSLLFALAVRLITARRSPPTEKGSLPVT